MICRASGVPQPEVEWLFVSSEEGEEELTPVVTDSTTLMDTVSEGTVVTSNLTLLVVQPSSSGLYICTATNPLGNDTSLANLTVFGNHKLSDTSQVL